MPQISSVTETRATPLPVQAVTASIERPVSLVPASGPEDSFERGRQPRLEIVPSSRPEREAVSTFFEQLRNGRAERLFEAENKTGRLRHEEAVALFSRLPTLTSETTPTELLELGLIPRIPPGLESMWSTQPRYFVGRQVLVNAPVNIDYDSIQFHAYQEDGEVRATHRAYLVGSTDDSFLVCVDGREEPLTISKREVFSLNEGQGFAGPNARAYGVEFDYAHDALFKAKLCSTFFSLQSVLEQLDFRTQDPALVACALERIKQPPLGTPVTAKLVMRSLWSYGAGSLSKEAPPMIAELIRELGGSTSAIGPFVAKHLATLEGEPSKDLGEIDWEKFVTELQSAIARDTTLAHQKTALEHLHGDVNMTHPDLVGPEGFGTNYRPRGRSGEAGKLANGGIGVCNVQASVLFGLMEPFKRLLGFETQLEMGCCVKPRRGHDGAMNPRPPHGWVMTTFWPSGERFVSDRTWRQPCLSLDYAFSPNGNRRHLSWDPHIRVPNHAPAEVIDMSGTFRGPRVMQMGDPTLHGRPEH